PDFTDAIASEATLTSELIVHDVMPTCLVPPTGSNTGTGVNMPLNPFERVFRLMKLDSTQRVAVIGYLKAARDCERAGFLKLKALMEPIVKAASGSQRPPVQEVQSTIPIITRDTTTVTTMPTIDDIDKAKIGLSNIKGLPDEGTIINKKIDDTGTGGKGDGKAMDDDDILEGAIVERMPEFPGGKDALVKYLLRNINQPNDLELSDKLVVIAEFVVNKQGDIDNIKITQHARKDIEDNVVKVISKMPRWKPGFQNGKNVSVYYSLPITFISNDTN
ncbi:MAG: energy transducer TonB, partial [Bacteroidota bacterium]